MKIANQIDVKVMLSSNGRKGRRWVKEKQERNREKEREKEGGRGEGGERERKKQSCGPPRDLRGLQEVKLSILRRLITEVYEVFITP